MSATDSMLKFQILAARQAHLVWLLSIVNIGIGFVIPGFNPFAQSISEVALEAPIFAFIHRFADVGIGVSMCVFAIGLHSLQRRRVSFAVVSIVLLGGSMISAGVWTLESPLHLLYNLSIFMIIVPLAFALEFKERLQSASFDVLCLAASFLHVFMFWIIYAGFIPPEYNGLIQRLWAVVTMGWFGVAASLLHQDLTSSNLHDA